MAFDLDAAEKGSSFQNEPAAVCIEAILNLGKGVWRSMGSLDEHQSSEMSILLVNLLQGSAHALWTTSILPFYDILAFRADRLEFNRSLKA